MNTFKKKSLYAAVASIGTLGFAGAVQAVNVNADGLGQVLIYPYYTTQGLASASGATYNSLLSVVNSTGSAKAVKVRFIEGKASKEVLDFNLFLSHHDVWTAAIVPLPIISGTDPAAAGAGVFTMDHSCTVPTVSSDPDHPTPFVNFAYLGDGGGDDINRTREGYVEIIEMGIVTGTTETGVTHSGGPGGSPTCDDTDFATAQANTPGTLGGGLFGGISLINVLAGVDISENAVALDNFRTTGSYDEPGLVAPDLQTVSPPVAVVFNGQAGVVSATGFAQNVDAVSALFMVNHVYNEFVLDAATGSRTDWVLTMPTKRYYFDNSSGAVNYLFQRNFTTHSCDDVGLTIWDREEFKTSTPQGFSPPPPPGKLAALCWEANVLTFNNPSLLGSVNTLTATTALPNGWADLVIPSVTKFDGAFAHFLPATAITTIPLSGTPTTAPGSFIGLPIIGFQAQSFTNGALLNSGSLVQANYAAAFAHRFTRSIAP